MSIKTLTEHQVKEILQIPADDDSTLTGMRYRKQIKWFKVGREVRFTEEAVRDYIEQKQNSKTRQDLCVEDTNSSNVRTLNIITLPGRKKENRSVYQRGAETAKRLRLGSLASS